MVRVASAARPYKVIGYKGKQVRDQIHSQDVIRAFEAFYRDPRPGEVYNLGGGRGNAASTRGTARPHRPAHRSGHPDTYDPTPRVGDHICYITIWPSSARTTRSWELTYGLDKIIDDVFRMRSPHSNVS